MRKLILSWGASALLLPLLGCGTPRPSEASLQATGVCGAIAADYAAALPSALACDPAAAQSCSAARPLVVVEVTDGGNVVQGLCDCRPFAGWVNPASTGALDEILSRFTTAECSFSRCPCPSGPPDGAVPTGTCRAGDGGGGTCS